SWRRQDITAAQLNDIGVATAQGEMNSFSVGGNFTKQLSAIDTLSFGTSGSAVEIQGGSAQSFRSFSGGPTWTRSLNSAADWVSSGSMLWTVREGGGGDTKFTQAMTGFRLRPNSRLRVTGSAGFGIVNASGTSAPASTFGSIAEIGAVQQGS